MIRHGQAKTNTRPDRIGGRSNSSPLTRQGRAEAETLGRYLLEHAIAPTAAYVSTARRARHTMERVIHAASYKLEPIVDRRLQEMGQGAAEGRLRSEIYTDEVLAKLHEEQFEFRLPGGESINDVGQRMHGALRSYTMQHPDETILIVSHGMAINSLLGTQLDWSHEQTVGKGRIPANASLTRFVMNAAVIAPHSLSYVVPHELEGVVH